MHVVNFEDGRLENFYKLVSKNVIRVRKEKNVSQLKLSNAIGHQNASFLGKAELNTDNKHFNLEHLYKISIILEVDITEFFKPID